MTLLSSLKTRTKQAARPLGAAIAVSAALGFAGAQNAYAAQVQKLSFENKGQTLAGELYLPDDYQAGDKLASVLITGAWTTVKEQMSANYARELANKGYAAMVFDFRGWGESEGQVKYLESPSEKSSDIHAAIEFLQTHDAIDANKIAALGICASAGYISDVAASNNAVKSFALVAPWLHNQDIVNAVYGGEESVQNLIEMGENAGLTTYIEAASLSNSQALMYQAPYYTESSRGAIPEYDNKFNVASWGPWLTYDAIQTASIQQTPGLLVHSQAAAIPQGAEQYAAIAGESVNLVMLDNVTQFDFYDKPEVIEHSVKLINEHFAHTL